MDFQNKSYCGSVYKERGEWLVYIYDMHAMTFKKDWISYFETKSQAMQYAKTYYTYN